jgi:predicted phage terminase large subunit-like protein
MVSKDMLSGVRDPLTFLDEVVRRDFTSFALRAFPTIRGGATLDLNWHIEAIAQSLAAVDKGECRRLLITLPPRNLKSFTTSVAWVAWQLGRDPRKSFVCVSYSNELSAKFARDCKAIMQSDWYRRCFPKTVISATRTATNDFDTTLGGGRLATSIGGTLTGRGGDVIIIDDPHKPDEANSDTMRESVVEWFSTTLASRLNDKKNGAIITVMQRLHQYDLAGMLLETGDWAELCIPAIATQTENIPIARGRTYSRPEGETLHAEREPLAELLRIKASIGSTLFEAQYQQQPLPAKGNIIRAEWLKIYDDVPTHARIVQSWDTASKTEERCDYSVCITAAILKRKVYVLDVWRERVEFNGLYSMTRHLARSWNPTTLLIEDAGNGTALLQHLRNNEPRGVPSPLGRKPKLDKLTRLEGVTPMIEAGDLLIPSEAPWLATFKAELLGFPSTRHDDQVDALSQLMSWVDNNHRNRSPGIAGPILFCEDGEIRDYSGVNWNSSISDLSDFY